MKKIFTIALLLIISVTSFSQSKYTILERGWERTPVFTDTVTKHFTSTGGFPVYTSDLDSLLKFVGVFRNLNKLSLKRAYFNSDDFRADHLFFYILNVKHAYGDLYDIEITSELPTGTYKMKLISEKGDIRGNKLYINLFYKYIEKAIKMRDVKNKS